MAIDHANRMTASQIAHLAGVIARDSERLIDDVQRFAASAGRGERVGSDARNLAEAALRLSWQAARLDGMREIAELHTAEES